MKRVVDDIEGTPVEIEIFDPHEPFHGIYSVKMPEKNAVQCMFVNGTFRIYSWQTDSFSRVSPSECEWWHRC